MLAEVEEVFQRPHFGASHAAVRLWLDRFVRLGRTWCGLLVTNRR